MTTAEGWEATAYYEDNHVLMIVLEVEGMGTAFRHGRGWHTYMPEETDLSDSEPVSLVGDDLRNIVNRYDENDPTLADFLRNYSEQEII